MGDLVTLVEALVKENKDIKGVVEALVKEKEGRKAQADATDTIIATWETCTRLIDSEQCYFVFLPYITWKHFALLELCRVLKDAIRYSQDPELRPLLENGFYRGSLDFFLLDRCMMLTRSLLSPFNFCYMASTKESIWTPAAHLSPQSTGPPEI